MKVPFSQVFFDLVAELRGLLKLKLLGGFAHLFFEFFNLFGGYLPLPGILSLCWPIERARLGNQPQKIEASTLRISFLMPSGVILFFWLYSDSFFLRPYWFL